jgi:hypothetical protein
MATRENGEGPWLNVNGTKRVGLDVYGLEEDGQVILCLEISHNEFSRVPLEKQRGIFELGNAKRWRVEKVAGITPRDTSVVARIE